MAPGIYRVELRKAGHEPVSRQITLERGQSERLSLSPKPILSSLKVLSTPEEADIFLNGERVGTTPHIVRDLMVGEYELELRKQGFGAERQKVLVTEGAVAEISLTLSSTGSLSFTSEPSAAELYINGERKGVTPITLYDLTAGSLKYELRKEGYTSFASEAIVTSGQTSSVQGYLLEQILSIPEEISYSGAGFNKVWIIEHIEQFPDNVVEVFNRWGQCVFRKEGYDNANPWMGYHEGKALPEGTYVYIIELNDERFPEKRQGHVTISR